ncbi:MAG TPA: DoxX family protein [Chloroflexota bacterium]|jgi:putative oxidoreductase
MKNLGLLLLRLTFGGLLMGHGAQKLFGAFDGHGPEGTGQFLESMGMRPGRFWARVAGWCEFGGGLLTALGCLHPAGPMLTIAPMAMATTKAHAGKPIWVTAGGAELPVTNMAIATALTFTGPGIFSFDAVLGTRLGFRGFVLMATGLAFGLLYANGIPPEKALEVVQERTAGVRQQAEKVLSPAA